ncbi:membrane-spanning 4-domains subfamily A member 18 [Loxodonta africana]|uniref:membrane-spanning 4-domains subfamily A member 18 n=1 Tax=Loxodonta africana TaxID=9785 RepID=UPI0030D59826
MPGVSDSLYTITTLEIGANSVPGIIAPDSVHISQPRYPLASGNHRQPLGVTTYPASSRVVQCNTGRVNFQNPLMVHQNPAGVTGAQSQLTVHQYPAGTAGLQTSSVVVENLPRMADPQTLPQNPQNPPNFIPGPMGTSNQFRWNTSFGSFSTFDPKKFINEEVRTFGAIQILTGLLHIFLGVSPLLYELLSVTRASGCLFWEGLSVSVRPCGLLPGLLDGSRGERRGSEETKPDCVIARPTHGFTTSPSSRAGSRSKSLLLLEPGKSLRLAASCKGAGSLATYPTPPRWRLQTQSGSLWDVIKLRVPTSPASDSAHRVLSLGLLQMNCSVGTDVFSAICSLVGLCILVLDTIIASEERQLWVQRQQGESSVGGAAAVAAR